MNIVFSPVAQAVKNVATCLLQSIAHNLETVKGDLRCAKSSQVETIVILKIINLIAGKCLGVLLLMV